MRRRLRTLAAAAALTAGGAGLATGCHMVPPADHCNATMNPGHALTDAYLVPAGDDTWAACQSRRYTSPYTVCTWYVSYATHEVIAAGCS